ncbi:MAG: hypothetical protein M1598_09875 [Actinobacteria bacterium]|nr:hypothetical protein [Actinomycetota bacterium]
MITPSLLILSDEIYTEQGVVSGYLAVRDRVIISISGGSFFPRAGEFAALRLAWANPARLAGVGDKKGGLTPGKAPIWSSLIRATGW